MRKYAIVIEKGPANYSAFVPLLPGCVTTAQTLREVERNIRETVELHLEGLREDGEPIPEPATGVAYAGIPPLV